MAPLIQSLKVFFLIFTTGITIYFFIKNYKIGFKYYMYFVIISALLGFARPIFAEEIIIPVILTLSAYVLQKNRRRYDIPVTLICVLFYAIFITLLTKDASFKGSDRLFIYGFVLLIFSNYLFSGEKNSINFYFLIWLFALANILWLTTYTGEALLKPIGDSRMVELETGLSNNSEAIVRVDPNYFGFIAGNGFLLSLLFLIFRKEIYKYYPLKFLQSKWFHILIIFITILELWLSIRGLSRGVLLALTGAIFVFFLLNRKFKTFAVSSALLVIFYFVFRGMFELILLRFSEDSTGSGRYEIWGAIWKTMIEENRLLVGFGLNYPWWKNWIPGGAYISSHNSWISLLLNIGLVGFGLLIIYILKTIRINYKAKTTTSKIRLVMLTYFIVSCFSIEPLVSNIGWILFAVSIAYDKYHYSI